MPVIYCIVRSRILRTGITLLETFDQLKSALFRSNPLVKPFVSLLLLSASINAHAALVGGEITAGIGNIQQAGNTTTTHQQSQNVSLNWQQFDIAPKETVHFVQPNAHALAINRILGSHQASQIQGQLNANGQVWLINPNGVLFGKHSIVNVGGLIASTLDIADSELNQTQRQFKGSGTGQIINQGKISTIQGGYVAMIANVVSNQGHINTPQGTTALAGGSQVTVTFAENHLTGIRVDKSTLNNLVENKQLIRANGGTVIMTAGAHDSLLHSAVNNSGIVEARTIKHDKGNIILLGGMEAGTTTVKGTLDASAPENGDGGTIETSAAHVKIAPEVHITTQSAQGKNGTWLLDPQDYIIAASGGDITGTQVGTLLNTNNIIIISSQQGQTTGNGDLYVEDTISWSNSNSLTLVAERDVVFSLGGEILNTAGGKLNIRADASATDIGTIATDLGTINISGAGGEVNFYYNPNSPGMPDTFNNVTTSSGTVFTAYMLVNTPTQLQAIPASTTDNYGLGADLDLGSIPNFTPISNFSGKFTGKNPTANVAQNYTLSNLTITGNNDNVGLFDTLALNSVVKNLNLDNVDISGGANVGALAGRSSGTTSYITASGSVTATTPGTTNVGGIIGFAEPGSTGQYINSSVNVNAPTVGSKNIGGFAGQIGIANMQAGIDFQDINITGSITTGEHSRYVGGFTGYNVGYVQRSSYTGTMTTPHNSQVGGFVGYTEFSLWSSIFDSCTTANITAGDTGYDDIGGFVGFDGPNNQLYNCYATGTVTIVNGKNGGGFVGNHTQIFNKISNSYATGNVIVTLEGPNPPIKLENYGGFTGFNYGDLTNVYALGDVTVTGSDTCSVEAVGGLIGFSQGGSILSTSFSKGNILITAPGGGQSYGGLIGYSGGTITNVYASGNITVEGGSGVQFVGGLFGTGGVLVNGYSVGKVTVDAGVSNVGGLIGFGNVSSGRSFWDTETSGQATSEGGTNVVGMSTENMQNQTNFTSATPANGGVNPNWNFSTIWKMSTENFYPELIFDPPVGPASSCPQPPPDPITSYYPLTLNNITAEDKTYDGTTDATISSDLPTGILPGDDVSVTATGEFVDKNAGEDKSVTVNNPTLSGPDAGKYIVIPSSSNDTTATIFVRPIIITADGVNKVYDGNTSATVINVTSADIITPDEVNINYTNATFDTKDVDDGKTVTLNGVNLTGADALNYTFTPPVTTTADITTRTLTITADGVNKVYDGNTSATVTNVASADIITPDEVNINYTNATFDTKDVDDGKTITLNGVNLTGADALNYTFTPPVTTTADITTRPIAVAATGQNKVYDGNTNAQVTLSSTDIIAGDIVNFSSTTANFVDKNVADDIDINVTGISKSGTNQGNYTLINTTAITKANITHRPITITATGQNREYDGTTNAAVTLNTSNIVPGESITFTYGSATFANVGPGVNIPITVTGIITSDVAISNYTFNDNTTTLATIFRNNLPGPNPEPPDYLAKIYPLQSLAAALQKPFTGCLYHSYDRPLTRCLFREYEPLNLFIIAEGIRLPRHDLGKLFMYY